MMGFVFLLITLLLSQHLDICDSTACGWTNHNFIIDSDFNDMYVEEGILENYTNVYTIIVCQKNCLSDAECISFFSNRFTGMCKLLGVKLLKQFVQSTQLINDNGARYYNLQDPGKKCTDYVWDRLDNKCYDVVNTLVGSFDLAKQSCVSNGEDLLVTETALFLERVKRQIKSNFVLNTQSYFLGATDANTEGVWKWVNGDLVSTNNWRTGYPKNQTDTSDYMLMVRGPAADWLWIDSLNDIQPRKFICERYISDSSV